MRRWNGWGEESLEVPVPEGLQALLDEHLGPASPPSDVSLAQAVDAVPASRIPDNPAWSLDRTERLLHARGQSTPDWIALRSGRIGSYPDAVAQPRNAGDISELFRLAHKHGLQLIPYGGGTSVVGHINPVPEPASVTVDMRRMSGLLDLNKESGLATFGAGSRGPEIEARLADNGFTLGHFPQSFEYSTLGGWIATRSTGQQSDGYGGIRDLFRGGLLLTPSGRLELPSVPSSAAGPDLREIVLGSEGRLGVLARATVRVQPLPEKEEFRAAIFPNWGSGQEAARSLMQDRVPLSMLRLSDPLETAMSLTTFGRERLLRLAERSLGVVGLADDKCLMLYGLTGTVPAVRAVRRRVRSYVRRFGGLGIGGFAGENWRRSRFKTPYLRNSLWEAGYAVDTMETAHRWDELSSLRRAVLGALRTALTAEGERAFAFGHLSHRYSDGASLYFTVIFRLSVDPGASLNRWRLLKAAALRAILENDGTLSHHHGVGVDHRDSLVEEIGPLGLGVLESISKSLDPGGLLNPGKLLDKSSRFP